MKKVKILQQVFLAHESVLEEPNIVLQNTKQLVQLEKQQDGSWKVIYAKDQTDLKDNTKQYSKAKVTIE